MDRGILYTDRQAEIRAETSREESFKAQLSIMMGYLPYRGQAEALWYAYESADEAGKEAVMEQAVDLYEQFNLWRLGPETVAKLRGRSPYANVGVQLSGVGDFDNYTYQLSREDALLVQEWKQEVLGIIENFKGILADPDRFPGKSQTIQRIIGENPEKSHLERLAIALFVNQRRARWSTYATPIRALIGIVLGGIHSLGSFGKKKDFCADAAIVTRFLADEFGYRTSIVNVDVQNLPMKKGIHQAVIYEDGARFDPYLFPHLEGYLANPERYFDEMNQSL